MNTRSALSLRQEQQEKSLFLFVVVMGFIITFTVASQGGTQYSLPQLLLGITFGVIYLSLGFFEDEVLRRFTPGARNAIFFPVELVMVFGIGWMLGPGGNWLMGLPLASIAVERLPARSRWFVYAGLLVAISLPIARYSTWANALMNAFIVSTAIFFVDLITRFRLNEQHARERAEELAVQLEGANHKLAEYASQAEELAATQERNRLAHEIHDTLGHYLTIVNVQIEAAKVTFDSDPQRSLDSLDKAHELVKKGLMSVRESVSALRTSPVKNRPLQDALASLIDETRFTGITVEFHVLGAPRIMDEKVALAMYRAAQEGLTNVRKHANASHVNLDLDFSEREQIRLFIQDDGHGAAETGGGFGLIGIRERVNLLGGNCYIETQPGKGFCLEVTVPVSARVGA
jgi:signal transduction histidine kinase